MDRRRLLGILLVVVSAFSYGSGALLSKPVYAAGADWLLLLTWRFTVGAILAWAWLAASARRRAALRALTRRSVGVGLLLGILYIGNSGTYYAALETVSASLAALIVYVYPALVAVLALRVGRPLAGARAWSALGLALLGVVLAVGGIDAAARPPLVGLLAIIASPFIYAVWIVIQAHLSGERRHGTGEATAEGADPAPATALITTATAVAYWVISLSAGRPVLPGQVPGAIWPELIAIGAVSTFLAIVTFYAGTRLVGAAQASLISTVEPIWTIALASVLLGERLGPLQLLGGALIVGGVLLAQTAPAEERTLEPAAVRLADE